MQKPLFLRIVKRITVKLSRCLQCPADTRRKPKNEHGDHPPRSGAQPSPVVNCPTDETANQDHADELDADGPALRFGPALRPARLATMLLLCLSNAAIEIIDAFVIFAVG